MFTIANSSNEGDVGLGSVLRVRFAAVHAAEKLRRQWIGIDITHLARLPFKGGRISLIEKRLKDAFPRMTDHAIGIQFEVEGTPKDLGGARNLAERHKYQFQWWAILRQAQDRLSLVGAQPYQGKKKGAEHDRSCAGIDGLIYFYDTPSFSRRGKGGGPTLGEAKKIVVSVKGGENVSVAMVRDFAHGDDRSSIAREQAAMGFFVTLAEPTGPMTKEAVSLGFYHTPSPFQGEGRGGVCAEYPKLQILTIEGLMSGTERPRYPDLSLGRATFKRAAVEDMAAEQGKLL